MSIESINLICNIHDMIIAQIEQSNKDESELEKILEVIEGIEI